jgi:hypothetical protein
MESTFMVFGPSAKQGEEDKIRFGTGVVIFRRVAPDSDDGQYVLVTAKHVFKDIKGEVATVNLRKLDANGNVVVSPFSLKIRDKDKLLYTTHPTADVAVIDVTLPFRHDHRLEVCAVAPASMLRLWRGGVVAALIPPMLRP